jgi:hypothetical protein
MGERMSQLIQKSARKDCYFLAIKRTLHDRKLQEATAKRQARQQFVTFKNLVLTTFNAKEIK